MTATEVLEALEARGVEVHAEGDRIHFRPRDAAADLVDAMRTHKPELLRLLSRRRAASPWPESLPGLGSREIAALTRCARCGDGTFAQASFADRVVVHEKVVVARRHLTEHFDEIEAPHGFIRHVEGEPLTRSFARAYFFQVRYAAGSARRLPGGLDDVNLFVVDSDKSLTDTASAGHLGSNIGYSFGMYIPQSPTPLNGMSIHLSL